MPPFKKKRIILFIALANPYLLTKFQVYYSFLLDIISGQWHHTNLSNSVNVEIKKTTITSERNKLFQKFKMILLTFFFKLFHTSKVSFVAYTTFSSHTDTMLQNNKCRLVWGHGRVHSGGPEKVAVW